MDQFGFATSSATDQQNFRQWSLRSGGKIFGRRRNFSSLEESLQIQPLANAPKKDATFNSLVLLSDDGDSESMRQIAYEERMDMLWEHFNELELCRTHCRNAAIVNSGGHSVRWMVVSGGSKSGQMFRRRRRWPSLRFMLRVLSKLFVVKRTSSDKPRIHVSYRE